jgi:hypothetical protein
MRSAHSEILRGANHDTRSSAQALPEKQKKASTTAVLAVE